MYLTVHLFEMGVEQSGVEFLNDQFEYRDDEIEEMTDDIQNKQFRADYEKAMWTYRNLRRTNGFDKEHTELLDQVKRDSLKRRDEVLKNQQGVVRIQYFYDYVDDIKVF